MYGNGVLYYYVYYYVVPYRRASPSAVSVVSQSRHRRNADGAVCRGPLLCSE